jgi:hypothetical protein
MAFEEIGGSSAEVPLAYKGTCDAGMAASATVIVSADFIGLEDDTLNNKYWMTVLKNDNSAGNAPEQEYRQVTDYASATGTVTCDAFTANVEEGDIVMLVHESVGSKGELIATAEVGVTGVGTQEDVVNVTGPGKLLYVLGRCATAGFPCVLILDIDGASYTTAAGTQTTAYPLIKTITSNVFDIAWGASSALSLLDLEFKKSLRVRVQSGGGNYSYGSAVYQKN